MMGKNPQLSGQYRRDVLSLDDAKYLYLSWYDIEKVISYSYMIIGHTIEQENPDTHCNDCRIRNGYNSIFSAWQLQNYSQSNC